MTDKTNEAQAVAQPTNRQDADRGNVNAIRHIAYSEGWRDGRADGVRRGMEMALAAINAERLHDPTDSADDRAYEMAIEDCDSAVRTLIAALPLAQEDAKDAAEVAQGGNDDGA